jgi:hypothetical protein
MRGRLRITAMQHGDAQDTRPRRWAQNRDRGVRLPGCPGVAAYVRRINEDAHVSLWCRCRDCLGQHVSLPQDRRALAREVRGARSDCPLDPAWQPALRGAEPGRCNVTPEAGRIIVTDIQRRPALRCTRVLRPVNQHRRFAEARRRADERQLQRGRVRHPGAQPRSRHEALA